MIRVMKLLLCQWLSFSLVHSASFVQAGHVRLALLSRASLFSWRRCCAQRCPFVLLAALLAGHVRLGERGPRILRAALPVFAGPPAHHRSTRRREGCAAAAG